MGDLKYKRVLVKLSGEALAGEKRFGIDPETCAVICQELGTVLDMGAQMALVIGGGNIFRGLSGSAKGMERSSADYMGMLATVMNALAVQDALEKHGYPTRKATKVDGIYDKDPAKHPDAVKFDTITYDETLTRRLGVMDATAFALVRDANVPIIVCRMLGGDILRAVKGEKVGTIVCN